MLRPPKRRRISRINKRNLYHVIRGRRMRMKIPKINLQKLFDNNKFVIALSVVIAVIALFLVKLTIDNISTVSVKNVPISIDMKGTAAENAELSVVGDYEKTVTLTVTGKRSDIGGLSAEDVGKALQVVARPSSVTKAGEYTLELKVEPKADQLKYEINSISPDKVTLRFDTIITKEFPISIETGKLETESGFIQEEPFAQPETISVSGPKADVDKIAKCVAKSDISGVLTETVVKKGEVTFYDANNNKLEFDLTYTPTTVDITVPVYKQSSVPITFGYTNVPDGFPIDLLNSMVKMSHSKLTIATPGDAVDSLSELTLGNIDFRKIDIGSVFHLEVNLPAGYRNIDNVAEVTVEFPSKNMSSKSFTISNLNLVNVPKGYTVKSVTRRINNVKVIGNQNIVKSLTAADITATIDLLDVTMTNGRFSVPVKFTIPNKGLVWVSGEYNAIIETKQNS